MSIASKISNLPARSVQLLVYLYYQKLLFGISNTKFNISFTVFRESFLGDIYQLRKFAEKLDGTERLFFLDVGRNHGFVFYYFLHHLRVKNINISQIQYVGIDPSPIKFAYNDNPPKATEVAYRLIDKAVVHDDAETVKLKYGERNLGNFNVSGSNYEKSMRKVAKKRQFIEIEVETMTVQDILALVNEAQKCDAAIVKIDCKNRNEVIMEDVIEAFSGFPGNWLVACERDGASEGRLDGRVQKYQDTLVATNAPVGA